MLACLLALSSPRPGDADQCVPCHRKKTPAAVEQWRGSAHAKARVGCAVCHGKDHKRIDRGETHVSVAVCGRCHKSAARDHLKSRHGQALHRGWGCTRSLPGRDKAECRFCHDAGSAKPVTRVQCAAFLKQSSAMGQAGCNRCHQVERTCASCHTNHRTNLAIVRNPNVCARCHMGPDHPQWEMWTTSVHGTLYRAAGSKAGPTCQTCHMVSGHDVSRGLTMTPTGKLHPPKQAKTERRRMLEVCKRCHSTRLSEEELTRGDRIRAESVALVKRAEAIIRDLADEGLLDPMPGRRPPHPLKGRQLVLDAQMLYEEISHIERLFYKMKSFDLAKAVKGAYHQNAAYTHWYGNAELKLTLADIQAEASRLRARRGVAGHSTAPAPAPDVAGAVERRLQILKRKLARGAISKERYQQEKRRLLEHYIRSR